MRTWQAAAAAAGAAAALTIGGLGIADAVTAIPANTIHGCVTGPSRALNHVYTSPSNGTTCPSGSFQVIWPSGPTTAGPAGLDVQVISDSDSGGALTDVKCPTGHPWAISDSYNASGIVQVTPILTSVGGEELPTGWQFVLPAGVHATTYWVTCTK